MKIDAVDARKALFEAINAHDDAKVEQLLTSGQVSGNAGWKSEYLWRWALKAGASETVMLAFASAMKTNNARNWAIDTLAKDVLCLNGYSEPLWAVLLPHLLACSEPQGWSGGQLLRFARLYGMNKIAAAEEERQVDALIARKIRVACQHGWTPGTCWREGRLPYHHYLEAGFSQCTLACIAGGTDPYEPMRVHGLTSPKSLVGWSVVEALLRSQRAQDIDGQIIHVRCRA